MTFAPDRFETSDCSTRRRPDRAPARFGHDAYATLELKAAAIAALHRPHHALVDGNKRLAWLATVVILDVNGHAPALSHVAAFDLVMGAADGTVAVEQIAACLRHAD